MNCPILLNDVWISASGAQISCNGRAIILEKTPVRGLVRQTLIVIWMQHLGERRGIEPLKAQLAEDRSKIQLRYLVSTSKVVISANPERG
jgi:hypothetical protein